MAASTVLPARTVWRVYDSPLGPLRSEWTEHGLYRLDWCASDEAESEPEVTSDSIRPWIETMDDLLDKFFRHGRQSFAEIPIDPAGWTPFTADVYRACREIEPATTVTYKQLAAMAGSPNASRAVGAAMARNRVLLVIPCHRVISTGGGLRGFSAAGGLATKQMLLDLERDECWAAG